MTETLHLPKAAQEEYASRMADNIERAEHDLAASTYRRMHYYTTERRPDGWA